MEKFYDEIPEMTFFVGDTLPIFVIKVNRNSLEGCAMRMVISKVKSSEEPVIDIECGNYTTYFSVHLTSEKTKNLVPGTYRISFIMSDDNDTPLTYVKLSGLMHVRSLTEE